MLEHNPQGQPAGRPYLRSVLHWLLNYSPYHVAFWTGSQKATAVRCLDELDLGLIKPSVCGRRVEILHPKIVALWAREDFGLSPEDFTSYVALVKDLDKLWNYLREQNIGDWNETNTVMVDDTPAKLRAQPFTLIGAPTYDYPVEPSFTTRKSMLDTFLIELVGMLDTLAGQRNFTNFIRSYRWYELARKTDRLSTDLQKRFVKVGVDVMKNAGAAVDAEGRSPIPLIKIRLEAVPFSEVAAFAASARNNNQVQVLRPHGSSVASLTPSETTDEEDEW
ncbi:hypothetical protein OIO90_003082 [Microbotryomycetes sp. JL221]|nr:hypothetical protein OIO90_003082 [Microbotryomycetes sp. JL221]